MRCPVTDCKQKAYTPEKTDYYLATRYVLHFCRAQRQDAGALRSLLFTLANGLQPVSWSAMLSSGLKDLEAHRSHSHASELPTWTLISRHQLQESPSSILSAFLHPPPLSISIDPMAECVALVSPIVAIVLNVVPRLPKPHSVAGRLKKGDKIIAEAHELFDRHRGKMTEEQVKKCSEMLKTYAHLPVALTRMF